MNFSNTSILLVACFLGLPNFSQPLLGQTDSLGVAHFFCVWPQSDSLLHWEILCEHTTPDCEHFFDETNVDPDPENCNAHVAYRNANFMHFVAPRAGMYYFMGIRPGNDTIAYHGMVRLGEDVLSNWGGGYLNDDLPVANMNWLETNFLFYPFCD